MERTKHALGIFHSQYSPYSKTQNGLSFNTPISFSAVCASYFKESKFKITILPGWNIGSGITSNRSSSKQKGIKPASPTLQIPATTPEIKKNGIASKTSTSKLKESKLATPTLQITATTPEIKKRSRKPPNFYSSDDKRPDEVDNQNKKLRKKRTRRIVTQVLNMTVHSDEENLTIN